MLNNLRTRLQLFTSNEEKFNYLREYCQLLILKVIDDIGGFKCFAFVGGTALRILYDLRRYSEDLDFCLVNSEDYPYIPVSYMHCCVVTIQRVVITTI